MAGRRDRGIESRVSGTERTAGHNGQYTLLWSAVGGVMLSLAVAWGLGVWSAGADGLTSSESPGMVFSEAVCPSPLSPSLCAGGKGCGDGGRCVLNGQCLCSEGLVGSGCTVPIREWEKEMESAPDAAIGPDADVTGKNPTERWRYMSTGPMMSRYELAAAFLAAEGPARCRHVLEVGGLSHPVHEFLRARGDAAGINVTNLDPLSRPMLTCARRAAADIAFHVSLPHSWDEHKPAGDEDCFVFLGIHCDGVPADRWETLRGMKRLVVEQAAGEDYDSCVAKRVLPIVGDSDKWSLRLDMEMDVRRSRGDGLPIPASVPDWRLRRRLLFFERKF